LCVCGVSTRASTVGKCSTQGCEIRIQYAGPRTDNVPMERVRVFDVF
jgi:hypothetical protein